MSIKKITSLLLFIVMFSCGSSAVNYDNLDEKVAAKDTINYRQEMRNFVVGLSAYAKNINPNFIVIPQNGIELITSDGEISSEINTTYLDAIDGHGQEDLFYGYTKDNGATPKKVTAYITQLLQLSKNRGKTILVTDYCSSEYKIKNSQASNNNLGFVSFAATERDLNVIPNVPVYNASNKNITTLNEASNFLYLLNPENYELKDKFISDVANTNYDVLIIDLFFNGDVAFTVSEIEKLKIKENGGKRLVICYMSIGEAEDYRYYWKPQWKSTTSAWLDKENRNWPGNYKVKYWNKDWKNLIFGNEGAYLDKILDRKFDGVYLDIIDAFNFFEEN